MIRTTLLTLALCFAATPALAQNCLPRQSAVEWLRQFEFGGECSRVDWLFSPRREAWWCGGSNVIDFPPEFITQRGSALARHWYFVWDAQYGALLWPLDTVRCLCNLESCQVRPW